jgi:hypothetical protein
MECPRISNGLNFLPIGKDSFFFFVNRFIRGFLRCVSGGFQRVSMMGNSLSVISQTTEIVNDFESRFAFLFFYLCVCWIDPIFAHCI